MNKLTIVDIAKLSGVSKSTVSRVINEDENVSKETFLKVSKVIAMHNFIPNKSASNLKSKKRKTVLLATTRLDSYVENRIVRGVLNALDDDYEAIITESRFSKEKLKDSILNNLKYVDAIIIFAISGDNLEYLKNTNKQIIVLNQNIEGFTCLYNNDFKAMNDLLISLNSLKKMENIVYIGLDDQDITSGKIRSEVVLNYAKSNKINLKILKSDFQEIHAYDLIKKVNLDDITHIICATDKIAMGVNKHLQKMNFSIILGGIGDYQELIFYLDDYTTVHFHFLEMGKLAANMIQNKIKNESILMDFKIVHY